MNKTLVKGAVLQVVARKQNTGYHRPRKLRARDERNHVRKRGRERPTLNAGLLAEPSAKAPEGLLA